MLTSFPPEVSEKLGNYVYRLIDPRNGETFYVGKGTGNRVFAHVLAQIDHADPSDQLKRTHEIRATGSVRQGLIVGAFVAHQWLPATSEHFPNFEPVPGRYGFVGVVAPEEIAKLYIHKRLPDEYRKRGAANPVKSTFR